MNQEAQSRTMDRRGADSAAWPECNRLVLELSLLAGQLLLENGAETYRAEQAALHISNSFGMEGIEVFAIVTSITVDISVGGAHHVGVKRIRRRGIDLSRLEHINDVVRGVCEGKLDVPGALEDLSNLRPKSGRDKIWTIASSGIAAGLFATMLGGGAAEAAAAFAACLVMYSIAATAKKSAAASFFTHVANGFIATAIALAASAAFSCDAEAITLGAMLPLFPGVAMVNAIRDAINGDLVSGVARFADALLVAAGLAVGAVLGFTVKYAF